MNIKFTNSKDSPERDSIIANILPKETIIATILEPTIEKALFKTLAQCVRLELAIYRAYPKNTSFGEKPEPPEEQVKTFDPRTNEKCFMGKAFRANTHVVDSELTAYRKAIGTIPHPVWGDCTLLEIWGGDHFEEHNKMVVDAFKYGTNQIEQCPTIEFHVNPLFQNKKSKTFKLSPAQKDYKDEMDMLLMKAMIFGVNTPKQAKAARKRK